MHDEVRAGPIVLACVSGFLAGQIIAALLVALVVSLTHFTGGLASLTKLGSPPWWSNGLSLMGLWIGFGLAIVYARKSGNLKDWPGQWRFYPRDVLYIVLGVALQGLVGLAYRPFHLRNLNRPVHHLFGSAHGPTFLLLAVMTSLGAPIIEEWFFRGVLFRALQSGFKVRWARSSTWAAVLVSASLFGAAHGEPLQFAGLAFLGVVVAIVTDRTKRLIPSMLTHASFNAVAMVSLILQRSSHYCFVAYAPQ